MQLRFRLSVLLVLLEACSSASQGRFVESPLRCGKLSLTVPLCSHFLKFLKLRNFDFEESGSQNPGHTYFGGYQHLYKI